MNARSLAQHVLFIASLFVLCFGNAGFAQIVVQPMVISETSAPDSVILTSLKLQNMMLEQNRMSLTPIDLARNAQGQWTPLDLNSKTTPSNLERSPSCRDWIQIDPAKKDSILLEPKTTSEVDVTITIPSKTKGTYWAAVKCSLIPLSNTGVTVRYDFIVPVILTITEKNLATPSQQPARHFSVYPITHELQSTPGKSIKTKLYLENLLKERIQLVTVETIDLLPDSKGQWVPIRSDKMAFNHIDDLDKTSCRDWISLGDQENSFLPVPAQNKLSVDVTITTPPNKQGQFYSALKVTLLSDIKVELFTDYEFIIPIMVNVKQDATQNHARQQTRTFATISSMKPLRILQDSNSKDPDHSYRGENTITLQSNKTLNITASAMAASVAEGKWTAKVTPKTIGNQVEATLSVNGTDVRIENLFGPKPKVVDVTVTLIPHRDN